jgi:hypothetical protein
MTGSSLAHTRIPPPANPYAPSAAHCRAKNRARLNAIETHIEREGRATPEDLPALRRACRAYRIALGLEVTAP